jgi:hypothetical protein
MGKYKWKQLGLPYPLETTEPPSMEALEQVCGVFRAAGLNSY